MLFGVSSWGPEGIYAHEQTFINSNIPERVQAEADSLAQIQYRIMARTPQFLAGTFEHLSEKRASMNDQIQATRLFESGRRAIASEDWDEVRSICSRLWDLMPAEQQASPDMRYFTGLV